MPFSEVNRVKVSADTALKGFVRGGIVAVVLFSVTVHTALGQASTNSSRFEDDSTFCEAEHPNGGVDLRGLSAVYCLEPGGLETSLQVAHRTARPVFYGAIPVAWTAATITRSRSVASAAYRLTASQGVTFGLTVGMKYAISRPRPYVNRSLTARSSRHRANNRRNARLSFPSGHASLAVTTATSWSLSYPRWYVIAPGLIWATGVSVSRVHMGVHYPSDIVAGAVLGAGVAVLVHQIRGILTPGVLRADDNTAVSPALPVAIRIRF